MIQRASVSLLYVLWPFFFVNIAAFLFFTFVKKGKEIGVASIYLLSLAAMWAITVPPSMTTEKLNKLDEGKDEQRIYHYKDNFYFVGTDKPGVFMLSADGSVKKIIDSDTKIASYNAQMQDDHPEDPFCVKENILYFRTQETWQKLNLDSNETLSVPGGRDEARCGYMNKSDLTQILGVQSFIQFSQISDDGYIYYSNDTGLYRIKPGKDRPRMLVSGPVTTFNVKDNIITYYHVEKKKIETQQIPVSPELQEAQTKPPTVERPKANNDPKAAQLHAEGLKQYEKGNYNEAIEVWIQELSIEPTNANTANNIAIAYSELDNLPKALEYCNKSLSLAPTFGHAFHTLGSIYLQIKDFSQAKDAFEKAIEYKWDPGSSSYNLGHAYIGLQDYKNAEKTFINVAKMRYYPAYSYYWLGYVYRKIHDHEKAVQAYHKALQFNPNYAGAHLQAGKSLKALGKYWSARKEFLKEIEIDSYRQVSAKRELQKLRKEVWYLNVLDRGPAYLFSFVIWLAPIASLFLFLYLMKRTGEFFRPNRIKAGALVFFMFLFPFPMYIEIAAGILPSFIWYLIIGGINTTGTDSYSYNFYAYSIALAVFLAMLFVCYLMVCGLHKLIHSKKLLWGVAIVLIIVSFLNINVFAGPTGNYRWTSTAFYYKSIFGGIFTSHTQTTPEMVFDNEEE